MPIPKKGNLSSIKNWRPITLLPLPGKLLEKIVHKTLSDYLESAAILSDSQFGFRPNRGTSEAVFSVLKDLYDARDDGKITATCFIDYCKAFDSVHHPTLVRKICALNIHSKLKKWLMEYLAHRSHCAIANSARSEQSPVGFGVPQGSILGPLLFILFINDISDCIQNSRFTMYADDIVLYASHSVKAEADRLLQEDLDRVGAWCNQNYMTINVSKSMCMYFGPNSKLANIGDTAFLLHDAVLPTCTSYPYLGVELDGCLSLTPHMNRTRKLFGNKLHKLNELRKTASGAICLTVYKVMMCPAIDYCSFYTGGAHSGDLIKLQRLQNRALRICERVPVRGHSIVDLHVRCKVEMLDRRRKIQLLGIMWKRARAGGALKQVRVRTRGDLKIRFAQRRAKTCFYEKSPYFRGVKLWDGLDKEVQKLNTCKKFKHAIVKLPLLSANYF